MDKLDEKEIIYEWDRLNKNAYNELLKYLNCYPESVHRDEIDDLMWKTIITGRIGSDKLYRYLCDMPEGRHVAEAEKAFDDYLIWEEVKHQGDIIVIKDYMDNNPSSLFIREARAKYFELKEELLKDMKENPSDYDLTRLRPFLEARILTKDKLMDEGLITDHSWEMLTELDREQLPIINQKPNPNIKAPENCTDIFLFGTPSTGKTCLLMGLAGANGNGYSLQTVGEGGQYISDLSIYAQFGITPGGTFGPFVTVINGTINEETSKGEYLNHRVNFVEMSGDAFKQIDYNPNEESFENMGTGVTELLMNNNRKVFFIIVDPTILMIPFRRKETIYDEEGNEIDSIIRKTYISQNIILNKLTSLFTLPENQKIMERVDAIHFIVTKADTLGDRIMRNDAAREKLNADYRAAVTQLETYVRQTQRINASTDFKVQAFTFSLGKFYLGDVFEYDYTDSLKIIDEIRCIISRSKKSWFDRLKEF